MTTMTTMTTMTKRSLTSRRALEMLGLLMIGDGFLAAATPSPYALLWVGGPRRWKKMMQFLADRPSVMRALGLGQLAAGLWIARRQQTAA